jgi:hypothetical protein
MQVWPPTPEWTATSQSSPGQTPLQRSSMLVTQMPVATQGLMPDATLMGTPKLNSQPGDTEKSWSAWKVNVATQHYLFIYLATTSNMEICPLRGWMFGKCACPMGQ